MIKGIYIFLAIVITGISLFLYSLYEPYTLTVQHYDIQNDNLTGLKIVFATDFHIAPYSFEKRRLRHIINEINKQNPDIVILGGDYVNGHKQSSSLPAAEILNYLRKIKSRYGMFAVLGNHEAYYGKNEVIEAFEKAEITLLENQNLTLSMDHRKITLAGVKDYSTDLPDIEQALKNAQAPTILISHSPDIFPLVPQVDLVLAGHTHGGQIVFPFIGALLIPSDYGKKYRYGKIIENGNTIIISKGLGTSLLPLRFNCKPEIVVIEFK